MTIDEAAAYLKQQVELSDGLYLERPFRDRPHAPTILIAFPGTLTWVAIRPEDQSFTDEQVREHRCMVEKFGQGVWRVSACKEEIDRMLAQAYTFRVDYDAIADGIGAYEGE